MIDVELVETVDDRGRRIARHVAGVVVSELEKELAKWLKDLSKS